jgi:hypothetical protein
MTIPRFALGDSPSKRLVVASGLMLFLELTLIRWLGASVIHVGYFTNFVLLGSFLGIGLGFLRATRRPALAQWPAMVLVATTVLLFIFPVGINRASGSVIYFTAVHVSGPPMWLSLPLLFVAVAAILVGPAELVAREFVRMRPLTAYRWDLVGSLLGILLFTSMAFLGLPVGAWAATVAITWLILCGPRPSPAVALSLTVFAAILVVQSMASNVEWSPYSKLTIEPANPGIQISSNGVPHQVIQDVQTKLSNEPQYGLPYTRVVNDSPGDVLIIGAGTGSDVAIALHEGARTVTAVEIDPRLLDLGRDLHPDHPYDDPRVTIVNDDGRAFLERTDQTFDLILFALPDSLTLVNGGGGVRLESYLFTEEAISSARDRLTSDGAFAMYNYYREGWLVDRLGRTLSDSFGHQPCIDRVGGTLGESVLSISLDPANQHCGDGNYTIAANAPAPATDDHPFVYVLNRTIPGFYLIAIAAILAISIALVRLFSGGRLRVFPYRDLFFMGAAFLLLETRSVTTFALLFGTTWLVNAFVFAGILLAVLLAVEVTARVKTPRLGVIYSLLGVSLVVAFAVPNEWLLGLPYLSRLVVACALAFAPVFLANVAFAKRFAESSSSTDAFAINVLGAMVGGCLEYVALITGYRGLLILVGVLYFLAFALRPKSSVPEGEIAITT